jgi:hypothetical protein
MTQRPPSPHAPMHLPAHQYRPTPQLTPPSAPRRALAELVGHEDLHLRSQAVEIFLQISDVSTPDGIPGDCCSINTQSRGGSPSPPVWPIWRYRRHPRIYTPRNGPAATNQPNPRNRRSGSSGTRRTHRPRGRCFPRLIATSGCGYVCSTSSRGSSRSGCWPTVSFLGLTRIYRRVTIRARWVTLRARWVTLRARWVTLRARWVTLRTRWVTLRAR